MKQIPVTFPSGQLSLSGYCYYPDVDGLYPAVILCHPHSLYGGSMSNTVIRQLGSGLVSSDTIVMMFNFRGVGKSTGQYAEGIGEQEDVVAALDWLVKQPQVDITKIGLCGYSFGGLVGAPVACRDSRIRALALIAPALDESKVDYLKTCTKPKLFVVGEIDDMVLPGMIRNVYSMAAEPKLIDLVPHVDHFWQGSEKELCEKICSFFKSNFKI